MCSSDLATLAERGLAGFLVPRADAHQNEYVPRSAERLAWLTGFTGSAGFVVILATKAAIFVDGRYVIQVRGEIDPSVMTPLDISTIAPATWLAENAPDGARIDMEVGGGALALKALGGVPPFTWLVDGVPVASRELRRQSLWERPGPGFARLSVIDAAGRTASATIRIE